ncbi:CBS domain-containing protein [Polyangium sp. 15x6]|uniref:CBS domain-containing protein n=1 Tax=Polyangium sp. 15x6 TaxID=3042687 RepID=UPI00249CD113|nr:CBS domain-containing protein [Polyangium sp. 15x6]MDI3284269.1 CBS domain-containing protein [Polyangium sp. 15x6]
MQSRARRFEGKPVQELMTRALLTVQDTESMAVAAQLMYQGSVRHLPVMRGATLVGILSDRDILGLKDGPLLDIVVRDVMTSPVETTRPEASVEEASARMVARRIDCLPVLDEGEHLVGILTSMDILAERGRLAHKGTAGPSGIPLARDIMHRRVMTIRTDLALREAIQILVRSELRYLPVVNAAGRAVGMFSSRELRASVGDAATMLSRDGASDLEEKTVDAVMRTGVVTVALDASVLEIADKILDERQTAICVLDASERIVGIVTYVDVLAVLVGRKT